MIDRFCAPMLSVRFHLDRGTRRSGSQDYTFVFSRLTNSKLFRDHTGNLLLLILHDDPHATTDVEDRSSLHPAIGMGKTLPDSGWPGLDKRFPASEATRPVNMGPPVSRKLAGSTSQVDDPEWNNDDEAKDARRERPSRTIHRDASCALHELRCEDLDISILGIVEERAQWIEVRTRRAYGFAYMRRQSPMSRIYRPLVARKAVRSWQAGHQP